MSSMSKSIFCTDEAAMSRVPKGILINPPTKPGAWSSDLPVLPESTLGSLRSTWKAFLEKHQEQNKTWPLCTYQWHPTSGGVKAAIIILTSEPASVTVGNNFRDIPVLALKQ